MASVRQRSTFPKAGGGDRPCGPVTVSRALRARAAIASMSCVVIAKVMRRGLASSRRCRSSFAPDWAGSGAMISR